MGQEPSLVGASQNLLAGETNLGGWYLGTAMPGGFNWAYTDNLGDVRRRSNGEVDTNWDDCLARVPAPPIGGASRFARAGSGAPKPLASAVRGEFANYQNGISQIHFTGKYRDTESALDYFGARYYSSSLGRFLTPDWSATPEAIPYVNLENPQSLNLYSYVLNNPVSGTDPDGHLVNDGGDGNCGDPCMVIASGIDVVSLQQAQAMANYANRAIMLGRQRSNELVRLLEQHWKFVAIQAGIAALAAATDGAGALAEGALEGAEAAGTTAEATEAATGAGESATSLTEHGASRLAERGISQSQVDEAISSAKASGNMTTQMGKYGTPQQVYKGSNGVTVVVETAGRSAGKVITAFRH